MNCNWSAFVKILPPWMRQEMDKYQDDLLELRLRLGRPAELITIKKEISLKQPVSARDLEFCINTASQYSPWAAKTSSKGYITIDGGHRIGICGHAAGEGRVQTFGSITSLCIRVAREFTNISKDLWNLSGSMLIIGRPGCGKTTLLRDIILQRSTHGSGAIGVVDEKCEIFPYSKGNPCFETGIRTDVLTGCSKLAGVEMLIRDMNPTTIAMDEITASEDCDALIHAGWCGINLIATAHAGSCEDLFSRPVYKPIINSKLFNILVTMRPDKTWTVERYN